MFKDTSNKTLKKSPVLTNLLINLIVVYFHRVTIYLSVVIIIIFIVNQFN